MAEQSNTASRPTFEQKLAQSELAAQMVKVAERLDLVVIGHMLDAEDEYQTVGPILDPTAWRREGEPRAMVAGVLRAALDFARTVEKGKAAAAEHNAKAEAARANGWPW